MEKITQRILADMDMPDLVAQLSSLAPSDCNSLLLALFDAQTGALKPHALLKNYENNRFVKPSTINPIQYNQLSVQLLTMAQDRGVKPMCN